MGPYIQGKISMIKPHQMFIDSFEHYHNTPVDFTETLWNYFSFGLEPGGFGMAVLTNDFYSATTKAHPMLTADSFRDLSKWILNNAPILSYGSKENVNNWISLTDEQRRDIMIDCRLRPGVFDVLKGTQSR